MDCERCQELLVDYVSGELPETDVAALRSALEVCEHCRLALEKLERGKALASAMPIVEPPPAILAAVMRAAEARAAELAAAHKVVAPEPAPRAARTSVRTEEEGGLDGIWKWLASLLHGPQFAMAALLLLMVGVGLWWVPALSGPRPIAPPLVSDTPPAVGPSASLSPAERPHHDIDLRTGRVDVEEVAAEAPNDVETDEAERVAMRDDRRPPAVLEGRDEDTEEAEAGETLAAAAAIELGTGEALGRTETGSLPSLAPPSTAPSAVAPPPSTSPPMATGPGTSAERATGRSALGTYGDDEVPAPSPDESMVPTSLHAQARELVRAGSLAEAARSYERLLSEHPDYASAPRAMIELAEVYRRNGAISSARRWLERAARFPSVASDARRELARLDATEHAMDMESIDSADDSAGHEAAEPAPPP